MESGHKVQNWNRFYDPSIGRYLEPEPMLSREPLYVDEAAGLGQTVPVYGYAGDNPVDASDPTGNSHVVTSIMQCMDEYGCAGIINCNGKSYTLSSCTDEHCTDCGELNPAGALLVRAECYYIPTIKTNDMCRNDNVDDKRTGYVFVFNTFAAPLGCTE